MSILPKNPFFHLTDTFVQTAMQDSGFDPELEPIQAESIKTAGLIYDPDIKDTAWVHFHDNKSDLPISLKYPDIRFSQIFSEKKFGKEAPKIVSNLITALVTCARLQELSPKQAFFANEVRQVADRVFECLAQGKPIDPDIPGLAQFIAEYKREYKRIELKPTDPNDLKLLKTQFPTTYTLQIHKESGHLIGICPINIPDKMWHIKPVWKFMKNGVTERGILEFHQPIWKFSFIIIAYKHELKDPDLTKKLLAEVKTVDAPYESIFKLPIRGHKWYEEMLAIKLSPLYINQAREKLELEPFDEKGPLCFAFTFIPGQTPSKITSVEEYMNLPGLEKYRNIVTSQLEVHVK